MTVTEARAICASLDVLEWDDVAIARACAEATAALLAASPQVTPAAPGQPLGSARARSVTRGAPAQQSALAASGDAPGTWWVGASGLDGTDGESALAHALLRIARAWHPRPRVAIADSCVAAYAATWVGTRDSALGTRHSAAVAAGPSAECRVPSPECRVPLVIPPGEDAAFLAAAPLALVPMDSELRAVLAALGLGTAGAFARLEAEDVERRWGEDGLVAWRLARGEDHRRPVLARLDAPRSASAELAMPAETLEPVLFLVRAALDRLVAELTADGRAAAAVTITLTLDDARSALPSGGVPHTVTRRVRPARPVARAAPLFELCHALLDRWTLSAPVCAVTLVIPETAPLSGEQGDLMTTGWRDPAAADAAFTRLRTELGPDVVVRPIARDEHRPEQAGEWVETGTRDKAHETWEGLREESGVALLASPGPFPCPLPPVRCPRSTRLLEEPELADVECPNDVPCAVWWRGSRLSVDRATGPERLSGDWWKDGYHREYWRCESEAGELVIFRSAGQWYVQGWAD